MKLRWRATAAAAFAALSALSLPLPAWAQNAIQSISSSQQSGVEVIRIELNEALTALPSGFSTQQPPRIAIDLPGVQNGTGRGNVEFNQGNLRSVIVAQAGDRTRLVLNLKQASGYKAQLQGKTLLLVLDTTGGPGGVIAEPAAEPVAAAAPVVAAAEAAAPAPAPAGVPPVAAAPAAPEPQRAPEPAPAPVPAPVPAPAPAAPAPAPITPAPAPQVIVSPAKEPAPATLRDVDFRRGADGAGRVVVTLPSAQVGVDIKQQGQNLVVEFLRSAVPDNLRRRLDVTDFGTPVRSISTFQAGDRVRMTVEPSGAWEHSAYQTDTQFVLEVRPVKVDPNKLTAGPGFQGEKLSLNFQNIEVRALLQVIADFTNFNVVTSDTVTGSVTLRLKDVPWDQALDIILQSKGLGVRKAGNVLWIAPKEELSAKEQLELEAKKKVAELEPLRTQSFQLNYTKAEEVARGLMGTSQASQGASGQNTRILSPRGSVIYEARTNQVFVSDIPSKLEEVQSLISKIDIPVRQVLIEARIVEADDSFGRALGVKLGSTDLRGLRSGVPGYNVGGGNYAAIGGNYANIGVQTNQTANTSTSYIPDSQFINLPANVSGTAFGGSNVANFALSLFSPTANRFLNLELSALEAEGKGKIVSSPRVITADQVKALIEQGEELPYQSATSSGATAVSFKKANLKLEVTPQITPEGNVILDVDVNKDSVGRSTVAGFAIDTKHVKTQVLVENGGTVVIGGIYTQVERDSVNKVPLLGDLPFIGALFRNKVRSNNKTELLVFITPKIVTDRSAAR